MLYIYISFELNHLEIQLTQLNPPFILIKPRLPSQTQILSLTFWNPRYTFSNYDVLETLKNHLRPTFIFKNPADPDKPSL